MHRFLVSGETIQGNEAVITGESAHQIARVLRMRAGDDLVLFTQEGLEYLVTITSVGKTSVAGHVVQTRESHAEPNTHVSLYLSLLNKADKFEWALQKCTELGVTRVVPVAAARSVSGAPERGRRERWERIIMEATEQCGRTSLVRLGDAMPLAGALQEAGSTAGGLGLMPDGRAHISIADALKPAAPAKPVSVFIGPEGGFTGEELALAAQVGVTAVSLGPRVLRAETAAVAAVTIVLYTLGDMKPVTT